MTVTTLSRTDIRPILDETVVIFTAGIWLLCAASAVVVMTLLTRVYRGFDPSEDTPALS